MLRKAVEKLTAPPWITAVGLLFVGFWLVAYGVHFAGLRTPMGPDGHVVGGDFICFYGAGRTIWEGDGQSLYDPQQQWETQRQALGAGDDYRLGGFVNPPTWAVVLAPLTALPYLPAFHLHTGLMLSALALALRMLHKEIPHLARRWPTVVLLVAGFFPMIRSITGGQNTALSFLLLVGAYSALRRRHMGRAGVWLGLLAFKPQYALPLVGLLLLQRRWRAVGWAAVIGVAHYLVGAAFCGMDWPMAMLAEIRRFVPVDFGYNGSAGVSWPAVTAYALPGTVGSLLGIGCVLATIAVMIEVWRRSRSDSTTLGPRFGLAVCGAVLISPHTYFYDLGLLLLPALLGLEHLAAAGRSPTPGARVLLAVGFLAFPIFRLAPAIGFQPLLFWPLLLMAWCQRLTPSNHPAHRQPSHPTRASIPPRAAGRTG
ncbi:MAG: DUF2029 domain-containing protein [bacterium]|nr:DUF2029 domain-containing protein [bacterium]